ncbi:Aldo/keto reductase [Mycena sanguinolenta]|uniref:Aldo/keto reductase n=1 Tax=Mycena sanguinolenta TaxID=230812 RepID=A0A8H7DE89_9AGAR|nr:Aldo/keto reductase [Mycena sanguinolenta]
MSSTTSARKAALSVVLGAMTVGKPETDGACVDNIQDIETILDVFRRHGHSEVGDLARSVPYGATLKAIDELYREGHFKWFGISNYMSPVNYSESRHLYIFELGGKSPKELASANGTATCSPPCTKASTMRSTASSNSSCFPHCANSGYHSMDPTHIRSPICR